MEESSIIRKETGIAVGLVASLIGATWYIGGAIKDGTNETKLLKQEMTSLLLAVNLRIDNIESELEGRTTDRLTITRFSEWANRYKVMNPEANVPDVRNNNLPIPSE